MRIAVAVVAFVAWIGTNSLALANFKEGWEALKSGDYASAFDEWRPLAEKGDAHAQYNIGVLLGEGLGVQQNRVAALAWFRRSADVAATCLLVSYIWCLTPMD